jgi:hypothetical protein
LARPGHALREELGTNSNGLPSFHAPPGRTRVDRALVQCLVSVHGGPSALRIASGGIRSLLATSSGVGSRPIACRRCRQVRTILFKASMVSTDKLRCIFYPPPIAQIWRNPPRFRKLRAPPAAPGAPSCCRSAALPHNNRTMLVRLGFPRCEPGDFGIAFADDLRERAVMIHASPPENGRPPNAGTSTGRVFDLCPDDTKAMLLESGSEFSRGHLRLSNWFIGARHRASLSPPGGYRRDATKRALTNMYSGVEPIPRERRPKFEGVPNKGRRRCHDSHFRRPRADFSASMRWNGP